MGEIPSGVDVRERFSFDKTADQEDYIAVNRELVERVIPLERDQFIVDLCCGSGLFSRLISEHLQGLGGRIIGIDSNAASLEKAEQRFVPSAGGPEASFFVDSAAGLLNYMPLKRAQIVIVGNAFHELPGEDLKERVADVSYDVLEENGIFIMNSCFTDASESAETRWGLWKLYSAKEIGGRRNKETEKTFKPAAVDHFTKILRKARFKVPPVHTQEWPLSKQTMMYFAEYDTFIRNMFSDIDLPEKLARLHPDDPERLQAESDALKRGLNLLDERYKKQQIKAGNPEEKIEEVSLPRVWADWDARKAA